MINFKDLIIITDGTSANIKVCTSIYSMDAVNEATYAFTDNYNIISTNGGNDEVIIVFESKNRNRNINEDLKDFMQCLIEHQVRHQLETRNGKIRDIIVRHAFSQVDLHDAVQVIGGTD